MKEPRRGAKQLAELANGIVDPVLARRAGISTALLGSWNEIVGDSFADCTRPEKIAWPRLRDIGEDGGHRPGVLTIACEGGRALFLSHAQGELIGRINSFFGYPAVVQIRIVQKPVLPLSNRRKLKPLDAVKSRRLEAMVEDIESDKLKDAIRRLGRGVLGAKR
ncbi:DUF721 domain-containing protein [Rhizobium halophytocola]|uniref:DUF721 domain-containing protein n=1 Tax=Rhizobium halophytocola TaxID=735519 RepID=A0ABS4DX52_9HYPH|nr:DciA family protein [Rhizobium halophytocola]MBP1850274.1 hypothetical protein [Rhizobium halophytocola]